MNTARCLILTLFFLYASAACGTGLSQCNQQCYNPSQLSCVNDLYTNKAVLCPLNYQSCNGGCFSPSTYHCTAGVMQYGPATPAANPTTKANPTTSTTSTTSSTTKATTSSTSSTKATTSTTSNAAVATTGASQQTCNNAGCGPGLCNCNGACFTPGQYNCPLDPATGKTMLCQGSLGACNGACYDTTTSVCQNGAVVPIGTPVQSTGTPAQSTATPVQSTVATTVNPVINPNPVPNKYPTQTADLRIINSCKSTLWFEGRYGGQGAPIPGQSTTATIAPPGSYVDYTVPDSGLPGSRFWAKYGCDANGKNCLVGDQMQYWPNPPGGCPANGCTPPVDSLFEATWGCRPGTSCNAGNPTTWFDTSQVDGWTIPYKLTPVGDTSGCDCVGSQCGFAGVDASKLDLARCPRSENLSGGVQPFATVNGANVNLSSVDLRIINNGQVLGCLSPCKRLNWGTPYGMNQPESGGSAVWMCCPTPAPGPSCTPNTGCVMPDTCRAGPIVNTQYVAAVHDMAPGIYSYSYDDGVGLHACPSGVVKYTMEFCPAGSAAYPGQA